MNKHKVYLSCESQFVDFVYCILPLLKHMGNSDRSLCLASIGQQLSHQRWTSMNVHPCTLCQMQIRLPTMALNVKGWLIRLKFIGKTDRLFLLLFWIIPCIFGRNLIKFNAKLTSSKIDHFLHLRIHLLYTEQLIWSVHDMLWHGSSVCTHFFCFYSRPVLALLMWCKVECISLTIVCDQAQALNCFQCLISYPNIWITF